MLPMADIVAKISPAIGRQMSDNLIANSAKWSEGAMSTYPGYPAPAVGPFPQRDNESEAEQKKAAMRQQMRADHDAYVAAKQARKEQEHAAGLADRERIAADVQREKDSVQAAERVRRSKAEQLAAEQRAQIALKKGR
eukprot:m51a1_g12608 hypothetical protein (138) ;mRNA; r:3171-3972